MSTFLTLAHKEILTYQWDAVCCLLLRALVPSSSDCLSVSSLAPHPNRDKDLYPFMGFKKVKFAGLEVTACTVSLETRVLPAGKLLWPIVSVHPPGPEMRRQLTSLVLGQASKGPDFPGRPYRGAGQFEKVLCGRSKGGGKRTAGGLTVGQGRRLKRRLVL